MTGDYEIWMQAALLEAERSSLDVPVGCVIVDTQGEVIFRSSNSRAAERELLGHAEVNAVLALWGSLEYQYLQGLTLVTTLEPCLLCSAVIRETGITRVIFGAANPQRGAAGSVYDVLRDKRLGTPMEVIGGILAEPCERLLNRFFQQIRSG